MHHGGTFEARTSSTFSESYPIDAIFSLGQATGPYDTAIGFLQLTIGGNHDLLTTSGVPATITNRAAMFYQRATPSVFQYPTYTRMGYGCITPEVPTEGVWGKRYLQIPHNQDPDVVCYGDSGGPVFDGNLSDNGPIYGVLSDFGPINAYIPQFLVEELLDRSVDWGAIGVDRPGFDMGAGQYADSHTTCRLRCQDNDGCFAYSFGNNTCWLKYSSGQLVPGANSISNRVDHSYRYGVDRYGGDYKAFHAASREDCMTSCAADLRCRAYTYNSVFADNNCWLKSTVSSPTSCQNCGSGVKSQGEPNVSRRGVGFAAWSTTVPALDAYKCADYCRKNPKCIAYTYSPTTTVCWQSEVRTEGQSFTGGDPAAEYENGVFSAVRRGHEYNSDRPGGDYRHFDYPYFYTGAPDIVGLKCQAACNSEDACKAWAVSHNSDTQTNTCWLKSSTQVRTNSIGVTSGLKGMDFF